MSSAGDSPELLAISDFLGVHAPFDLLSDQALSKIAQHIDVEYFSKGHECKQQQNRAIRIIRSGAVDIRSGDDRLLQRMGEGESYILEGIFEEYPDARVTLYEDSLIYALDAEHAEQWVLSNRDAARYFHRQTHRRLRRAARYTPEPHNMLRPVAGVMSRDILAFAPQTSIQQAAQAMSARRISSAPIIQDNKLVGIITDRDFRSRVIAKGLDFTTPVSAIMTPDPVAIDEQQSLFDATLTMVREKIHHLPVVSRQNRQDLVGIVTASDLILAKQDDPVYMVQHIGRCIDIPSLKSIVENMPTMMVEWLKAGIKASQVSRFLTAISDAVTIKLIELFIEQSGPAPAAFCWLGFGSQGRAEQLINADQDNGLLISNSVSDEQMPWFSQLADYVCDGLNECGYVYCPGNVMAKNPLWRQPLAQWQKMVDSWTSSPTPDAVMRVSIFFDLRCVYGDQTLAMQLQQHMLTKASSNTIFLAALAANVLEHTPPLGLFRRFIVERNGEHKDALDIKKRGLLPITDIMRIHALANRIDAVNTHARIDALANAKVMTVKDSRNIQDAYDFILQTRAEAQANTISLNGNQGVSNFVDPDTLSETNRQALKDAFEVVNSAQNTIRLRYRGGL